MKAGNANPIIIDFDPFTSAINQTLELGASLNISDGRIFRFASAGTAGSLLATHAQQAANPKSNHVYQTASATSIGTLTINLTLGATAAVANEYVEGIISFDAGQDYKISSQPAIATGAAGTITVFEAITTAITTANKYSLVHNNFNGTIEGNSGTPNRATGIPLTNVAVSNYYWSQTRGTTSCLITGTPATGSMLTLTTVTGSLAPITGTFGTAIPPVVGYYDLTATTGGTGQVLPIHLTID